MKNSVFACQNPVETFWQLGRLPVAKGNLTLIGWRTFPTPIDDGMPEAVAEILARAMTSTARVTFLSSAVKPRVSSEWETIGDDLTRTMRTDNPIKAIWNIVSRKPSEVVLLSTRKPETAALLFDDAAYPWWMQGQIALLSEPEQTPPDMDKHNFFALFEDDWTQHASFLQTVGIKSVLRPGVDGNLAGFLSFTEIFKNTLLNAIENESRSAGFDWTLLPESDFAQFLTEI